MATRDGALALLSNTTGAANTAMGFSALQNNTIANFNTANGAGALLHNTVGVGNTASGSSALLNNTTGSSNTASGGNALSNNTAGNFNTAIGVNALFSNIAGSHNTANGYGALINNVADDNTAYGYQALGSNTIGVNNTAIGKNALQLNTGYSNTAVGDGALVANTSGFANTAIGLGALFENVTGSHNIGLGAGSGGNIATASNVICIGFNIGGADVSDTCFIGNIRGITTVNNDAVPVQIDSAGQLGTMSSSKRYKTDIRPMDKASESILALKPVSFRYNVHKDATPQYGLIAEQVAEVNPNLVIYDADGKPYTVRYDAVNAMLLNEFLKEHKAFVEAQHKVEKLETTVANLVATVKEQAVQIQKVSTQLEVSKAAPQTVLNNQ